MEKVKVEKYFRRIGLEMPETIVPNAHMRTYSHEHIAARKNPDSNAL